MTELCINWEAFGAISAALLSITLIIATIIIAYKQNKINKQPVKLQLFEKRYPLYEYILSIYNIINDKGDNLLKFINYIDDTAFEKYKEDYNQTQFKAKDIKVLFEENLSQDLIEFVNIYAELLNIIIQVYPQFHENTNEEDENRLPSPYSEENKNDSYSEIVVKSLLNKNDIEIYKEKFPELYKLLKLWKEKYNEFKDIYTNKNIEKSMQQYINIKNI